MKTALVFGASGQIGMPLLDRLQRDGGWNVVAVSRGVRADAPGLAWKQSAPSTVISTGNPASQARASGSSACQA